MVVYTKTIFADCLTVSLISSEIKLVKIFL